MEPAGGPCYGVLEGHTGHLTSVAYSPCGKIVATASMENVDNWSKHNMDEDVANEKKRVYDW